MTTQEKFLLAKKLLLDFKEYVLWIHKIAQGTDYDMTPSHVLMCDTLQKYAEGKNEKRNLMINCPPGTGKSLLLQYFITWCFARNKHCMFCYVAYGEKLIKKLSRDSRNLMMMPEWEELFGKEMDPGDKSVLNYHLLSGGIRSGLTAGTISSALLGCFAKGTLVQTRRGLVPIEKCKDEEVLTAHGYSRVEGVVKNGPAKTISINGVRCLPNHLFYTARGLVRADNLVLGDTILSSEPSNNISRNPITKPNNPSTVRIVKYIRKFLFSPHSASSVPNSYTFGQTPKSDAFLNVENRSCCNAIRFAKVCNSRVRLGYFYCLFWGYFLSAVAPFASTVCICVRNILTSRPISKVTHPVVEFVIVKMPNIVLRWSRTIKRLCNQYVYKTLKMLPVHSKSNTRITTSKFVSRTYVWFHNSSISTISFCRTYVSKIRNFVKTLKPSTGNPKLTIVSDIHNCAPCCTYCVTLEKKHNMFVGNSQELFLVHNCDAGNPASPQKFSGSLLLDDINSPEVSRSVHEQVETPDIYQRKLSTRRRTPLVPTIGLQQRIDINDFSGWIKKNEPDQWEFLIIPAIDAEGNSFYPKRYPIDELRRLEKQNPFMFAAMYQQEPVENYGAYFHEDWIKTFRATPEKFQKVFITTDFGFTSTGDKSLFVCWGLASDNNLYQLGSRMGKWESPDAKKYCVEFFRRCRTLYKQLRRVYVENTLSGIGFIQEMKRECPDMAIVPLKRGAKKNKLNRAESAMTWMEAGRVYFREADPNFVAMRAELLAYNPADKNPKDEWCFVAGTKIMTIWGERPIEDIKVGDILWTPIGWTKVKGTGHREAEVITRLGLTGTSDHKIWDPVHFRFDCLGDVCYFEPRLYLRSIKWRVMKSYLMANGISLTKRQDIISSMTRNTKTELARPFIGLFGNFIRERRYLRAMLFIILTATGVITTTLTLCALALLSTLGFIGGVRAHANGCKSILREPKTLSKKRVRGTRAKKAGKRLLRFLKQVWTRLGRQEPVCYAGDNLTTVSQKTPTTERSVTNVKTAGNTKRCDVVYTIKTGNGVYVANSRLVSNCDNVGDATELAFNNKVGSIFL